MPNQKITDYGSKKRKIDDLDDSYYFEHDNDDTKLNSNGHESSSSSFDGIQQYGDDYQDLCQILNDKPASDDGQNNNHDSSSTTSSLFLESLWDRGSCQANDDDVDWNAGIVSMNNKKQKKGISFGKIVV